MFSKLLHLSFEGEDDIPKVDNIFFLYPLVF